MEQALVSAVTAVMHDERHAPRLPITEEHLMQNPPLAALLHALESSTGGSSGNGGSNLAAVSNNAMSTDCSEGNRISTLAGSVMPDEPLLHVADGVMVDLADHYRSEVTNSLSESQGVVHTTGISSSNGSSDSHSASPVVCRLALTASTCTSLLSAPALLTAPSCPEERTLQQLAYTLGVVQRTSVVQHLLDMLRVVRADIAAALGASSWGAVALAGSAAGGCDLVAGPLQGLVLGWQQQVACPDYSTRFSALGRSMTGCSEGMPAMFQPSDSVNSP